jgi:hypothetical protein
MRSGFESIQSRFQRNELSSDEYRAEVNALVARPPVLEPGTVYRIKQAVADDIGNETIETDNSVRGNY